MTVNSLGLAREEVIDMLSRGFWIHSDLVCDAFSIPFEVALKFFDFCRMGCSFYFRACMYSGAVNEYYPPREV